MTKCIAFVNGAVRDAKIGKHGTYVHMPIQINGVTYHPWYTVEQLRKDGCEVKIRSARK